MYGVVGDQVPVMSWAAAQAVLAKVLLDMLYRSLRVAPHTICCILHFGVPSRWYMRSSLARNGKELHQSLVLHQGNITKPYVFEVCENTGSYALGRKSPALHWHPSRSDYPEKLIQTKTRLWLVFGRVGCGGSTVEKFDVPRCWMG
ncbi:hypothetical protein ARMSODRAFT_1007174 [Armillaria solidipes]|uniref:Uncharacterized protein n=1 Tax=Armillaria solidipes TaxID=1076256 RepID=A0A2H3BBC3_9AGAR|nr:hypothetical protein ARMSODRAFT_1007174 [Armillaria solidipes]